jgi:hypothetical protein
MTSNGQEAEWVIGRFMGEQAKLVQAHAGSGVGYRVLSQGREGGQTVVLAAFRRPTSSPLPDHLSKITDPAQIAKLERS